MIVVFIYENFVFFVCTVNIFPIESKLDYLSITCDLFASIVANRLSFLSKTCVF